MKRSRPLQNGPETVYFADEEEAKKVVGDVVLNLWEAVNNLTRLRPRRRQRYRVTIFGSARAQPGTAAYEETKSLARQLARLGCDIVTGGGPGLMQAANEGAYSVSKDRRGSIGLHIDLEAEQNVNPFVGQVYAHRTFFSRLHHFALLSDAFVVVPGGVGTTLETTMIWQLLQVRKIEGTPLILIGEMWADFMAWARRHMLASTPPLAAPKDLRIPDCVPTAKEAVALIKKSRDRWARQGRPLPRTARNGWVGL